MRLESSIFMTVHPKLWISVHAVLSYTRQETQISLRNRATRLEVSQGHQTLYHSIFVRYGFQLVRCIKFVREIFDFKIAVTSKTGLWVGQGHGKCHHSIESL